jgi:hypothetical protein
MSWPHARLGRRTIGAAFAGLLALSPAAVGQLEVVVYDLEEVWLDPVLSHPFEDPQPMTGSFEWTYTTGDFENGSGQFVSLDLPWWSSNLPELESTFDNTSIEINMVGNYHNLGVDVSLFFDEPLSPNLPSTIDTVRSKFEIEVNISHRGTVVNGGSVVPRTLTCSGDNHLQISEQTIDWTATFEACTSITVGPNLKIIAPGSVTLRAGYWVIFTDGLSVGEGVGLTVEIDGPP